MVGGNWKDNLGTQSHKIGFYAGVDKVKKGVRRIFE